MINWEVIMWTCVTIGTLLLILVAVYYITSARMMRKKRQEFVSLFDNLVPGATVMFAGMIGTIKKVNDEFLEVEIAKNTVVTISKYAVTNIIEK